MVLVDTSIWLLLFRKRGFLQIEEILSFDEIVTCLPVIQEVLQGFRDEAAFRLAREAMFALPIVDSPLNRETYEDAIGLYRAARSRGLTIRSSADCLIAASAIRHDLTVLHHDRDFTFLAEVSSLKQRNAVH